MLLICNFSIAQSAPYKVVFDVTTKDTIVHQMVIRWVKEILSTSPNANVEIVFYAKSLDMITKDKSIVADNVMKYAAKKNVAFRVCEVAMKKNVRTIPLNTSAKLNSCHKNNNTKTGCAILKTKLERKEGNTVRLKLEANA